MAYDGTVNLPALDNTPPARRGNTADDTRPRATTDGGTRGARVSTDAGPAVSAAAVTVACTCPE